MFSSHSLIPFVTAGHPDLDVTRDIVVELAQAGAALVEIGIPFSDPVADGPTIQRSSFEALRHGYTMEDYLALVREIRRYTSVPLIFMSYL
ncbi:MAG TPA: tryptophan synthase subunit alpha, partial [Acidobacteriota bacterium]|nr:tryptophan synthase subunit alpha [Acidobacteriota bacterium]